MVTPRSTTARPMASRTLSYGLAIAMAFTLSCDSKDNKGNSNGSDGASQRDPKRIDSPLTMDLSRPPQKKVFLGTSAKVRDTMSEFSKRFMAPSHGKWLAPGAWPYYEGCETAYNDALTVKASGDTLTLKGTVDIGDCVEVRNEPVEQGSVQVYAKLVCKGKNLAQFNDADLSALNEMPCEGGTDVHFIGQSIVEMKAKVRVAGIVPFDLTIKEQHSIADGNGQGCVYKGSSSALKYDKSCEAITKIAFDSPYKLPVIGLPLNKVTYLKADFNDLPFVSDKDMPWYESRKAKVEVDGWNGEVEYQGVNSSPRYRLKRGSASVDGSL